MYRAQTYNSQTTSEAKKAYDRYLLAVNNLNKVHIEAARHNVIFNTGLSHAYTADEIAEITAHIRNTPEKIRSLWNLFSRDIKVLDRDCNETAHYSVAHRGIKLSDFRDKNRNLLHGFSPYATLFHESGHLIDNAMNNFTLFRSVTFKGGIFDKTLKQEAEEYINTTFLRLKSEAVAAGKSAKTISKKDAYKAIENELFSMTHIQRADVSDIWEGATACKVRDTYVHGRKYWKEDPDNLSKEAFAEMFQAVICSPESLEQIKRYFPKSYEIFEEIIEEFVKGVV